jgi:hypothetical protein
MIGGRVCAVAVCAAVCSGLNVVAGAQTAPAQKPAVTPAQKTTAVCDADVAKSLVGTWKAPQYKMRRTSDVGVQVFGPNAFDVRDVELTIQPSGEGVLKISTSVVDQKAKTWAPTLVEAKIMVGAGKSTPAGRCEPAVTVTSAQEQFLDQTQYTAPLDGSRVVLLTGPAANQVDVRWETPKGEGSFWTTVRRQPSSRQ